MPLRAIVVLLLTSPFSVWAVVRLFGLESGYPAVPLMALTPLVAVGAILPLLAAVALRCRRTVMLAAATLVVLIVLVAPRAVPDARPAPVAGGATLRLLAANLRQGRASAPALAALVRSSSTDVVSVQELTPEMVRALDVAGLGSRLPYRVLRPRSAAAGTGIYSRVRLAALEPPAGAFAMTAAQVQLAGGGTLEVVAVHAIAPRSASEVRTWRSDLRALPTAARFAPPRILAGDFNATLDHRELRRLLDSGYADAAAAAGVGLRNTWPTDRRLPPLVAIDHVLVDPRAIVRDVSIRRIPGSDHAAVVVEIALPANQQG